MAVIRFILGAIILFLNWITTPRGIVRDSATQSAIDHQTQNLTLYEYRACPFCVKVRRAMKRQSLNIERRDAKRCANSRQELLSGGGQLKVPCLFIDNGDGNTQWLYESDDIISYLQSRFSGTPAADN